MFKSHQHYLKSTTDNSVLHKLTQCKGTKNSYQHKKQENKFIKHQKTQKTPKKLIII